MVDVYLYDIYQLMFSLEVRN